jgi:hypothetical protein
MMLTLRRDTSHPDATLGVLDLGDGKKLFTIEPPWVPHPSGGPAGAPFVSRVPAGVYRIEPFKMPSGEKGYVLSNPTAGVFKMPFDIPKGMREKLRSRVTIRAANYAFEAVDAIGVGMERTRTSVGWKLERSLDALNVLRTTLGTALDLRLLIEDVGGPSAN